MVNDTHVTSSRGHRHIPVVVVYMCLRLVLLVSGVVDTTLDCVVLINVLDAHQLVLLVLVTCYACQTLQAAVIFACRLVTVLELRVSRARCCISLEIEKFDERVVRDLLGHVAELLALDLDVVRLVVLMVAIVRLHLHGLAFGVWVHVIHVRKAHAPELTLVLFRPDLAIIILIVTVTS